MARPKGKESKAMTIRLDIELFDRLSAFSEKYGQPKTVAVERAIKAYIDHYEEMMKKAEQNYEYSGPRDTSVRAFGNQHSGK